MQRSDFDGRVTLRNGQRVGVRAARVAYVRLCVLLESRPGWADAIRRLAGGEAVDAAAAAALRSENLLTPAGALRDELRAVFLSAYHLSADGPVLLSPFAPASPAEAEAVAASARAEERRVGNLGRKLGLGPDDPPCDERGR